MSLKKSLLFALALTLAASCNNKMENDLIGHWRGFELLEEDIPLDLDPAEIRFEFRTGKAYSFSGTLNYKEEGGYRIKAGHLFTRDTLHPGAEEKAVRIEQFEADTLVLKMDEQGKTRILKLQRVSE